MKHFVRFAVVADRVIAEAALTELQAALRHVCPVELLPVYLGTYRALLETVDGDPASVSWAPPLVAHDLHRARMAAPLVAVGRRGTTSYYSAVVASRRSEIKQVAELSASRMGWVSELSAAGYIVPRLYLQALGLSPATLFARESFHSTHEQLIRALLADEVDAIATCATFRGTKGAFDIDPRLACETLLSAVGPIPGDVVMAGSALDTSARDALRGGLLSLRLRAGGALARLMNVDRFEATSPKHFDSLVRLTERAATASLRCAAGVGRAG